jgi:16S rRNA (guanine527-N7)-methyltransferase
MDRINNNEKFSLYYNFLVQENEKYNLTNITEKEEAYIKHFYDSIQLEKVIDFNNIKTLCDVGSGAGFPSIPLKIIYPHLHITIIEPTLKRCNFLNQLVELLQLDNVTIINDRAENMSSLRETFDIVTARAVASMPILLELCVPLTKVNGYFISLKGSSFHEEMVKSSNAIKLLDVKVNKVLEYELLNNYGKRSIIMFEKLKQTNSKYPRKYSLIKNKPL